jgi:hypothetical protein
MKANKFSSDSTYVMINIRFLLLTVLLILIYSTILFS